MPAEQLPPIELWFDELGRPDAAPVVLLPDASTPAVAWPAALLGGLVRAGHRVVRLDLAGQGRSRASPVAEFSELLDAVAATILRATGGSGCTLLGHGFGGTIALALALAQPSLVDRLVLANTSGWYADPSVIGLDEALVVGLIWRHRMGLDHPHPERALARELRLAWLADAAPSRDELLAEARRWHDWGWHPKDNHRVLWLNAPPLWSALGRLRCPVAVIHGAANPIVPVEHGRRLAELCAAADYREVPASAHALDERLIAQLVAAAT